MNNNIVETDLYNSRFSYIKLIMEYLEKKEIEKIVVGEIFNNFFTNIDNENIDELVIYSSLFENRINMLNQLSKKNLLNNLYDCYIKNLIINFSNRDMEMTNYFLVELDNKIKMLSGYYGLYEKGYFNNKENKKLTLK